MTDRPVIGILLALIIESAHWLKFRWDFNDEASARAWQFNVILIGISCLLIFPDTRPYMALPILLTWLPPLLLPMQFVQSFGLKDSMPLNTFSFLAKHRRKRNLRLGLPEAVIPINFGNILFVATLVASTLGGKSTGEYALYFLPGLIVLTGWRLLSATGSKPLALATCLIMAGGISIAGQKGLQRLNEIYGGGGDSSRSRFDPNSSPTLIGRRTQVIQSPGIVWRLRPVQNSAPPVLLRTATYNTYGGGRWRVLPALPEASQFKTLDTVEPLVGQVHYITAPDLAAAAQADAIRANLPQFTLRGSAFNYDPLPLPGTATSFHGFDLDSSDRNLLGTIRVFPKTSVIQGTVLWKGETNPETPPVEEQDLKSSFTGREHDIAKTVLENLQLKELPSLQAKLGAIRGWFERDFRYSRNLTIGESEKGTPLMQFLTTKKIGHCEYFATAAILLLREAGIPARYATGYAVAERDPRRNEYVIRGTHGHAWCRVWDAAAGRWIDFDTTPGTWLDMVAPQVTRMQVFNDWLKRTREDFFLWRNQPSNRLAVTVVMSSIALAVLLYIVKRLWKSKQRLEAEKRASEYTGPVILTPLNALEPIAEKRLGSRPPGQPLGEWLAGLKRILADPQPLDEAVELHRRLRFDPAPPSQSDRDRLTELAKQLQSAIRRR